MGTCECTKDETPDLPLLDMARSKYSIAEQYVPPPRISKMVSSSTIYSNVFKIANQTDDRVTSKMVRSRQKDLPLSEAAQKRDIMVPEEEVFLDDLGAKYVGERSNKKPHGFGKLYFRNNDYLQGTFVEGRCEGKGRYIKADGSYYQGDIKNNVADGHGIYIDKKNYKYEGQWKNNMPNGTGEAIYPDETRYVGEFLNNKKHGKGTLFQGGSIYRGTFKNDMFDGRVEYQGENGEQYKGDWKENKKHGYGVYSWPDGSMYEGSYENGSRNGNGYMRYANNDEYEGEWKDGQKHGRGKFISKTQNIVGVWNNGKLVELVD